MFNERRPANRRKNISNQNIYNGVQSRIPKGAKGTIQNSPTVEGWKYILLRRFAKLAQSWIQISLNDPLLTVARLNIGSKLICSGCLVRWSTVDAIENRNVVFIHWMKVKKITQKLRAALQLTAESFFQPAIEILHIYIYVLRGIHRLLSLSYS